MDTAGTIREVNRERVLTALRSLGAASRADLEHATGLSRGTVASIVTELLREDAVRGDPRQEPRAKGRPRELLRLTSLAGLALAVDVGHRHVRVAVGDAQGCIVAERFRQVSPDLEPRQRLSAAAALVAEVTSGAFRDLRAAILGLPTPVTADGRPVTRTFGELDPAGEIGLPRLTRRVVVMNDADLGAVGEAAFGAARGLSDFIFLKMSGGVGAGIMLGGRLYRGSGGVAGDIAHVRVREQGDWCVCGNRGCLETLVSAESLAIALRKAHPGLDPAEVQRFLGSGDPDAERLVYNAGWMAGRALSGVVDVLNPAAIVVGGTVGTAGEPLLAGLRESIRRHAQPSAAAGLSVHRARHGERAEVLGGIALAFGVASSAPPAAVVI